MRHKNTSWQSCWGYGVVISAEQLALKCMGGIKINLDWVSDIRDIPQFQINSLASSTSMSPDQLGQEYFGVGRPPDASIGNSIKLHAKHARAARVQQFVGRPHAHSNHAAVSDPNIS